MQLLPALRFMFRDLDDVAAYGADWRIWDDREIARMRAREQIALEEATGVPLRAVMAGMREDEALPLLAAMWIVLHREGHPVAWADFNPVIPLVEWEQAPAAPLDPPAGSSGEGEPTPVSPSSQEPTAESVSS